MGQDKLGGYMSTPEVNDHRGDAKEGAADTGGVGSSWDDLTALDDKALLARARRGDKDAFGELWCRYHKAGLMAARNGGADSPEDVVSEAYTRIWEQLLDGKGPRGDLRPYLYQTIRNIILNERAKNKEVVADDLGDPVATGLPTEAGALSDMDARLVKAVMAQLSKRNQQLLTRHVLEGLSIEEIAAEEGVKSHTITVAMARARAAFTQIWVQSHAKTDILSGEHKWVMEHGADYINGRLGKARLARVEAHLAACPDCAQAMAEVKESAFTFGHGLVPAAVTAAGTQAITLPAWGAAAPWVISAAAVATTAAAVVVGINLSTPDDPAPTPPPVVATTPAPSHPSPVTPPASATGEATDETAAELPAPPPGTTARPPATSPVQATPTAPAWAPIVVTADSGPGSVCYPLVSGTAEPGAALTVSAWGEPATTVQVGADGRWQTGPLNGYGAGQRVVTVVYSQSPGQKAQVTARVAAPPVLSVSKQPSSTLVTVGGQPSQTVEIMLDGQHWATVTLDSSGAAHLDLEALTPGQHTIAVRYTPPGCNGPQNTVTVTKT